MGVWESPEAVAGLHFPGEEHGVVPQLVRHQVVGNLQSTPSKSLLFKAHRLSASLNSRLESNVEEDENLQFTLGKYLSEHAIHTR